MPRDAGRTRRALGLGAFGMMMAVLFLSPVFGEQSHSGHAHAASGGEGGSFFSNLLKVYTPRQVCMFYEQPVVWLHVVSDLLIALAYYSIPFALVQFVRHRRDVAFSWMFWMFAAFILACGTTHLFGVIDIWRPFYRLDGVIKLITAIASIGTAIALWPLIPKAVALPSPSQLEATVQQRTSELAEANTALRAEMAARAEAEKQREALLASERAAREESERANRMKDEFLATLSHELRTPLTAILGWSRILAAKSDADGELREGMEVIARNARVQAQLVDDLLDMSRIISGKLRLNMQRVDLAEVIEAASRSVQPAAAAKGIALQKMLAPNVGTVSGDPARLQQVVWNLLSNAVKFTPRGGRVQVFLDRAGSSVEITVSDSGEGIRPDLLPHIFERFRQADSSSTRKHGGLGLGLAIVRHLVEMHGGSVRASSGGDGHGAVFTVSLPVRAVDVETEDRPEGEVVMAPQRPGNASLKGRTVLAVDDEADARNLIQRVLEGAGASVITAESAAEGIEMLKSRRPDVLMCDIGMPETDGYSFIRSVRKLDPSEGGNTPAVALTAFARAEDRKRALMAGFQMHVSKPVEPTELVAVVAEVAGQKR